VLKGRDVPARYGGEEFIVLLPQTPLESGTIVAEQVRKAISKQRLKLVKTGEYIGTITVSAGVAMVNATDTIDTLVERADQALYLAKHSGRNRVKSEKDLGENPPLSGIRPHFNTAPVPLTPAPAC
jgi:diguanylate cyclase